MVFVIGCFSWSFWLNIVSHVDGFSFSQKSTNMRPSASQKTVPICLLAEDTVASYNRSPPCRLSMRVWRRRFMQTGVCVIHCKKSGRPAMNNEIVKGMRQADLQSKKKIGDHASHEPTVWKVLCHHLQLKSTHSSQKFICISFLLKRQLWILFIWICWRPLCHHKSLMKTQNEEPFLNKVVHLLIICYKWDV